MEAEEDRRCHHDLLPTAALVWEVGVVLLSNPLDVGPLDPPSASQLQDADRHKDFLAEGNDVLHEKAVSLCQPQISARSRERVD